MKKILEILSVKFQVLVVKFSIYLNRRVFVMVCNYSYCKCPRISNTIFHSCGLKFVFNAVDSEKKKKKKKTWRLSQTDFCDFVCSLFPKAILFYFYFTVLSTSVGKMFFA